MRPHIRTLILTLEALFAFSFSVHCNKEGEYQRKASGRKHVLGAGRKEKCKAASRKLVRGASKEAGREHVGEAGDQESEECEVSRSPFGERSVV